MPEEHDRYGRGMEQASLPSRKAQLIELCVFLFLIFPSMVLFFFVGHQKFAGLDVTVVAVVFHDLALVSLLAFFVWRNGEHVQSIGWSVSKFRREALIGIGLFMLVFPSANVVERLLSGAGLSSSHGSLPSFLAARSSVQYVSVSLMVAVVAFSEETIFRGYLMLRLRNIAGGDFAAVIISSIIFSLGHGYEGTAGMITVFYLGVVLAVVYLWRRTLVAPMVIHFLQDFVVIVLLPLWK